MRAGAFFDNLRNSTFSVSYVFVYILRSIIIYLADKRVFELSLVLCLELLRSQDTCFTNGSMKAEILL